MVGVVDGLSYPIRVGLIPADGRPAAGRCSPWTVLVLTVVPKQPQVRGYSPKAYLATAIAAMALGQPA